MLMEEGHQPLMEKDNQLPLIFNSDPSQPLPIPAGTLTETTASEQIADSLTGVSTAVGPTRERAAGSKAAPPPWTPLQPFILECKLSDHPDKVIIRQLIYNL